MDRWQSFLVAVSFWGSIASLLSLAMVLVSLTREVRPLPFRKAVREFLFAYRHRLHYLLTFSILLSTGLLILSPVMSWRMRAAATTVVVLSAMLLLLSFFLRQSRPLLRQLILHHLDEAVTGSGGRCAAIKFDIDLLVAINDYSYATGGEIVKLAHDVLASHAAGWRAREKELTEIELPESDEVIWILPRADVQEAADLADAVRREVKRRLTTISYYNEACAFVIQKLASPPLTAEERDGIGTLSAGVAAYGRGVEALLSDISAAIKECKFRGRNCTIVYQREGPSIVRPH